jgi:hypothetical protein
MGRKFLNKILSTFNTASFVPNCLKILSDNNAVLTMYKETVYNLPLRTALATKKRKRTSKQENIKYQHRIDRGILEPE